MQMRSRAMRVLMPAALAATLLGYAAPSAAQDVEVPPEDAPIGRFAADARGAFPKFKQDGTTAAAIGVTTANLPGRALGLVLGAHWYPVRARAVTFGFGGELLVASRSHTLEAASAGAAAGPTVD